MPFVFSAADSSVHFCWDDFFSYIFFSILLSGNFYTSERGIKNPIYPYATLGLHSHYAPGHTDTRTESRPGDPAAANKVIVGLAGCCDDTSPVVGLLARLQSMPNATGHAQGYAIFHRHRVVEGDG